MGHFCLDLFIRPFQRQGFQASAFYSWARASAKRQISATASIS